MKAASVTGMRSHRLSGKTPARIWCLIRGQYRVYNANSTSNDASALVTAVTAGSEDRRPITYNVGINGIATIETPQTLANHVEYAHDMVHV